jgi:hypothetical protein
MSIRLVGRIAFSSNKIPITETPEELDAVPLVLIPLLVLVVIVGKIVVDVLLLAGV